jgi:hypothetical protein
VIHCLYQPPAYILYHIIRLKSFREGKKKKGKMDPKLEKVLETVETVTWREDA